MQNWRERGCVPDSDEDESFSIDSQTRLLDDETTRDAGSERRQGSQELGEVDEGQEESPIGAGESGVKPPGRHSNGKRLSDFAEPVQETTRPWTQGDDLETDWTRSKPQRPVKTYGRKSVRRNTDQSTPSEKPSTSLDQLFSFNSALHDDGYTQGSIVHLGSDHGKDQHETRAGQAKPVAVAPSDPMSVDSSPLSSPGSSDLEDFPMRPQSPRVIIPTQPNQRTAPLELNIDGSALQHFDNDDGAAERRFRSRKPIQLNPYLVEREVYKKSWQARGMVPVRIVGSQAEAPARSRHQQEETQDVWQPDDSQVSAVSQDSRGVSVPLSPRTVFAAVVEQGEGEDEFPDVDRFMHRNVPGHIQPAFKRRRLDETPRRPVVNVYQTEFSNTTHLTEPPTPPATNSATSSADNGTEKTVKFRLPRGFTRSGLVTPNVSSPGPINSTGLPTHNPTNEIVDIEDHESGESEEESSSVADDLPDFSKVRRRIKGVLPASWLRLDSKTQKPPSPRKTHGFTQRSISGNVIPAKGVAQRRIVGSSTPACITQARMDLTFDSDESEQESLVRSPLPLHRKGSRYGDLRQTHITTGSAVPIDVDSDDMEDNAIDPMFPSGAQPRRNKDNPVLQQARVTDTFQRAQGPSTSKRSSDLAHVKSKSTMTASRKSRTTGSNRPRRKRAPLLSILDAPQSHEDQTSRTPQFVRLASRQARQRSNHGRHSPSRKVLRLATAADTEDAMTTLTSWHKGDLTQRPISSLNRWRIPVSESLGLVREQPSHEQGQRDSKKVIQNSTTSHSRPLSSSSKEQRPKTVRVSDARSGRIVAPRLVPQRQREPRPTDRETLREGAQETQAPRSGSVRNTAQVRTVFRNGQLEMEGQQFDLGGRRLPHLYKATSLQQLLTRGNDTPSYSLPLQRYLKGATPSPAVSDRTQYAETGVPIENVHKKLTHRPRQKPNARRLDTQTAAYRQPSEPLLPAVLSQAEGPTPDTSRSALQGLGPYGTKYSTDFDIHPLEVGTYFHESTFIGSGDFDAALSLPSRNLDDAAGHITINVGDHNLRWSAWNEDVAKGLSQVYHVSQEAFSAIKAASLDDPDRILIQGASDTVRYLLRSVVRYCSNCLSFSDFIDREQCLAKFSTFIEQYADVLYEAKTNLSASQHASIHDLILDSYLYLMCLTYQMMAISQQRSISKDLCEKLSARLTSLCRLCVECTLQFGCHDLRIFYEDMRHHEKRDRGIRDQHVTAKAIIILHHISQQALPNEKSLAELAYSPLVSAVPESNIVRLFDEAWYDIFTLQPMFEIDRRGIYRPGSRSTANNDNWPAVKILLDRLFALYPSSSELLNPTLNDYMRTNLVRIYVLINRWHWETCEVALNVVYDFFAKRGLAHLRQEDAKGSPRFLEQIETDAAPLEISIREPTFHIFLKLLAIGLRSISQQYSRAKVQRIVWRYVPNHGRTYRKEEDVQRSDLDALQNHHDLLCTLVWTLPLGCRPRLDSIRNLVDFHASHQEACRINVNAWKILARIVVSRTGQNDDVDTLASWFREIVLAMSRQYRLARAEADQVQDMAHLRSLGQVSFDQVQMVVSKNQKKILDTLLLALAGMKEAIKTVSSRDVARQLMEQSQVLDVFKVFDASQTRTYAPVLQTLVVCRQYIKLDHDKSVRQESSEESQDYGSFDGFEDMVLEDSTAKIPKPVDADEFLQAGIAQLLSNVFGADTPVDESLLACLVEVWTSFAARSVSNGTKRWSQYLEAHSSDSWFKLRQTDNVRKWTPFSLSKILELDHSSFEDNKDIILGTWFVSLVERESMLKFQHILSSAILNAEENEELTENPPFARDMTIGRFSITLSELRAGRISLIGSVLSNMRINFELARGNQAELKSRYSQILKQAMVAMKTTYQEVSQHETAVADANVRGSYVTFVHQVVSMMQQHTLDICAIDRFFTDSAAFPLPSNDPEYVVGRIRKHEPKLSQPSGCKQLAVFLQTRSQAAAINNASDVLADQIFTAITPTGKGSQSSGPTLREMFFTAILPAYLQAMIEHEAGWILAAPMMEAGTRSLALTLYHINMSNASEAQAELELTNIILHQLLSVLRAVLPSPESIHSSRIYRITTSVFTTALPTIRLLDLAQRHHPTMPFPAAVDHLMQFALWFRTLLPPSALENLQPIPLPLVTITTASHNQHRRALDFGKNNLVDELRHWRKVDDIWLVRSNRVNDGLAEEEIERVRAIAAADEFVRSFDVVFGRTRDDAGEDLGGVMV